MHAYPLVPYCSRLVHSLLRPEHIAPSGAPGLMKSQPRCRDFVLSSYQQLKAANPKLPILIREAKDTQARLVARYGALADWKRLFCIVLGCVCECALGTDTLHCRPCRLRCGGDGTGRGPGQSGSRGRVGNVGEEGRVDAKVKTSKHCAKPIAWNVLCLEASLCILQIHGERRENLTLGRGCCHQMGAGSILPHSIALHTVHTQSTANMDPQRLVQLQQTPSNAHKATVSNQIDGCCSATNERHLLSLSITCFHNVSPNKNFTILIWLTDDPELHGSQ